MNEHELQVAFADIRAGDKEAFSRVYRDLSKPIYTVALRLLGQREAAEDVTQEIFLKLYQSPPEASVKHLRAWIFRMTHNLAIDMMRKQTPPAVTEDICGEVDHALGEVTLRLDAARAMSRLPQREREIVALRIHGELSFAEIARTVGDSLPSTYRAYRRALEKLREELRET